MTNQSPSWHSSKYYSRHPEKHPTGIEGSTTPNSAEKDTAPIWTHVLDVIEQPLVLTALALLAALVDIISHAPVLLLVGVLVLLGFHRSKKVAGKDVWLAQVPAYAGVLFVTLLVLLPVHLLLKRSTSTFIDEIVAELKSSTPPASPSPTVDLPQSHATPSATLGNPPSHRQKEKAQRKDHTPSASEIADEVAKRLGPSVKGGFHEVVDQITVSLGSVTADLSMGAARNGAIPFRMDGVVPVKINFAGDRILFNFHSWAGIPIEVEDNEVKIGNSNVDRNFSDRAFEVVNKEGEPIFQMIRKTAGSMQINGVFPTGNISSRTGKQVFMWVSDNGIAWNSLRPDNWNLKPIFKYPSWKYPGTFAD